MGINKAQLERLAILAEECAEVTQIAMKIVRHGYASYNPFDEEQTPNRKLLYKELGDVLFAIHLMHEENDIDMVAIEEHASAKRDKIREYLHHNTV